jgi:hypothetical protein
MPLLEGLSGAELPLYALTVWIATRLGSHFPDLIEPPDDPGHRGPFHSVTAYLLTLGKVAWLWVGLAPLSEAPLPTGPLWTYGRVFLVFSARLTWRTCTWMLTRQIQFHGSRGSRALSAKASSARALSAQAVGHGEPP